MPGWRDDFPGSPLVAFDMDDGTSMPVPRARAKQLGFVEQMQDMAAGAPLPPEPIAQPMPTLPGVGAVPVAPGVLPQPSAPAPVVPAATPRVTRGVATGDGPPPADPRDVSVVEELRDGEVMAPGFVPDAVSGGALPDPATAAPAPIEGDATGRGVDMDPEARAAQPTGVSVTGGVSGTGARADGPMTQEEVDQRAMDERLRVFEATGMQVATLEAKRQEQIDKLDRDYTALQKDLDGAIKKSADHRVKNPIDQWGTGRKIGTVLMAVISGIGSALKRQGDKNPALDVIMAHVDQSIALQMAERDKLGKDVQHKRQQLSDFDGLITNRNAKFLAERSALLESEARKIQAVGLKAASESVRFEYEDAAQSMFAQARKDAQAAAQTEFENGLALAKAQGEMAETEAKIGKLLAETRKLDGSGRGGGGGMAGKQGTTGKYASLDQIDPKFRDKSVRLPDGSWAITNSRESAKEATDMMASSRVMVQSIDRALEKVTSTPGFVDKMAGKVGWEGEDIAVIKQELTQLMLNGKNYYQLGALSENDAAIINRLGADPEATTAFVQQVWPKLQNWRGGITQDAVTQLQARGIDVGQEQTYGAAPEKPRAKATRDWAAEITARPTFDGDEIVAGPNLADAKQGLAAMRDAASNDAISPKEWDQTLSTMKVETRRNKAAMRDRLDAINAALDGGEKAEKAGKKDPWAPSTGARVKVKGDRASLTKQKAFVAAQLATYDQIEREIEKMAQFDIGKAQRKKQAEERAVEARDRQTAREGKPTVGMK